MLGNAKFQCIAQQVRNLLGCDSVQLFLGCAEASLCHPLLAACSITSYHASGSAGQILNTDLFYNERIWALCDVAMQTGKVQSLDDRRLHPEETQIKRATRATRATRIAGITRIQSIAVMPLERPAGVLGFLLLTDSHVDAFYTGERLLLSHYMPRVAQELETILTGWRNTQSAAVAAEEELQAIHPREMAQISDWEQRQRQNVDRLKNEFISMMSHEIRNPLTAIKGYAVLLQAYGIEEQTNERGVAVMSPQRQHEYLNNIMEQTRHLEVLINDLLDISRLHAGRLQLRYHQVNVVEECQRVVQLIQRKYEQFSARPAEIVCMFEPNLPCVWADSDRLQQVLTNLLDNAMKYSPDGGRIEVSTVLCAGKIVITVRDSGIGIEQEQQQYLFQPFKRLEHPLTNDIPGAGLGLYITQKLIEAMHGEITLSSCEGEGTTVTFSLPCAVHELSDSLSTPVDCQGFAPLAREQDRKGSLLHMR